MTPEEIQDLNKVMKSQGLHGLWVNIKKGDFYHIDRVPLDSTNAREGNPLVTYDNHNFKTCGFTRDYKEFMEKFRPAEPEDF